uniref:Major facilitator superfamily (MFS) profile domain-containing protein n=1 Tax=Timema tahoe TaxID=61484 RepID=A0A7R9I9H6_9NEOP|nr:unnamed protein product [Timema tahoe]
MPWLFSVETVVAGDEITFHLATLCSDRRVVSSVPLHSVCLRQLTSNPLRPLALSSASLKPILWDGEWEGERRGFTVDQSILLHQQEQRITEIVDGSGYPTVGVLAIAQGNVIGWLAPTLPLLQSKDTPIGTEPMTHDVASWVGSTVCLGAVAAIPIFSQLANKRSRKMTGYLAGIPLLPSWLLITYARTECMLYIARLLAGVTCGAVTVVMPLFVNEIAEDSIRGELGTFIALLFNFGVFFSFVVGSCVSYQALGHISFLLSVAYLVGFTFLPESPYYLLCQSNLSGARKSLEWYRGGKRPDIETELTKMSDRLRESERNRSYSSMREAFFTRSAMKGLIIGVGVCADMQLCGLFAILSYTVDIFEESGSDVSPYVATVLIAVLRILAVYASSSMVDVVGRRLLMVASNASMTFCLLVLGGYFYLSQSMDVVGLCWIPVVTLSLYIVTMSVGPASLGFLIVSEIFSPRVKPLTTTICLLTYWILMFVVIKSFTDLKILLGTHGCYWLYAAFCAVGTVFCHACVPETRNRSLESILEELGGGKRDKESLWKVKEKESCPGRDNNQRDKKFVQGELHWNRPITCLIILEQENDTLLAATGLLVLWSAALATSQEVAASIPGGSIAIFPQKVGGEKMKQQPSRCYNAANYSRGSKPEQLLRAAYLDYILSKCKDLEAKKEIELPKRSFRETIRCKFCGNEWHSGDYKATVLPQRVPGKKMLKIIDKKKNGTRLLRKFEEKLLSKYEKERGNKLILFCKVCHKNTFMMMNKPHFSKFMVQPDKKNIDDVEVKTKKKKKKKKKDYLCGLKQSAVSPLITGSRLRKFNTTSPVSTALTISQNADSRIPKSVDKVDRDPGIRPFSLLWVIDYIVIQINEDMCRCYDIIFMIGTHLNTQNPVLIVGGILRPGRQSLAPPLEFLPYVHQNRQFLGWWECNPNLAQKGLTVHLAPIRKGLPHPKQNSYLHWLHVKCMQPPLAREYRNLHLGQSMPFSARCLANPAAWISGSLASFHSANFSQGLQDVCVKQASLKKNQADRSSAESTGDRPTVGTDEPLLARLTLLLQEGYCCGQCATFLCSTQRLFPVELEVNQFNSDLSLLVGRDQSFR